MRNGGLADRTLRNRQARRLPTARTITERTRTTGIKNPSVRDGFPVLVIQPAKADCSFLLQWQNFTQSLDEMQFWRFKENLVNELILFF